MLVGQAVVLNVPSVEETVAEVPDNSPYPRAMYFYNFHSTPINIIVQVTTDGGVTWTNVAPTPVDVGSGEVLSMWVTGAGAMLRIRASGGNGGPCVYFGLSRFVVPSSGLVTGVRLPLISL